jgi:hypothetical protein
MSKVFEKSCYVVISLSLLFCDLEIVREAKGLETGRYLKETMTKINSGIPYEYSIPTIMVMLITLFLLFLFSDFDKKKIVKDPIFLYSALSSIMFVLLSTICYDINRDLLVFVSVFPFIFYVVCCAMSGIKNNLGIMFLMFILINIISYFFHKIFMETPIGNLENKSVIYYFVSTVFFWFLVFPFLERRGDK